MSLTLTLSHNICSDEKTFNLHIHQFLCMWDNFEYINVLQLNLFCILGQMSKT